MSLVQPNEDMNRKADWIAVFLPLFSSIYEERKNVLVKIWHRCPTWHHQYLFWSVYLFHALIRVWCMFNMKSLYIPLNIARSDQAIPCHHSPQVFLSVFLTTTHISIFPTILPARSDPVSHNLPFVKEFLFTSVDLCCRFSHRTW